MLLFFGGKSVLSLSSWKRNSGLTVLKSVTFVQETRAHNTSSWLKRTRTIKIARRPKSPGNEVGFSSASLLITMPETFDGHN